MNCPEHNPEPFIDSTREERDRLRYDRELSSVRSPLPAHSLFAPFLFPLLALFTRYAALCPCFEKIKNKKRPGKPSGPRQG